MGYSHSDYEQNKWYRTQMTEITNTGLFLIIPNANLYFEYCNSQPYQGN